MTSERGASTNTEATVQVQFTVTIPNDSDLRNAHNYHAHNNDGSLAEAVKDEVVSWWEGLGCTPTGVRIEVLAITDRP
jgi:hypothetical protein